MSDFDKYLRQGDPNKKEKAQAWQVAIGLQDVDGLKPSNYLIKTAQQHIEGDISIENVKDLIDSYYESRSCREKQEQEGSEEADKVSARITEILSENTFSFNPEFLLLIHKRLFNGLYSHAGKYREYNIAKKEWVLNGDTVIYSGFDMIIPTLEYDFNQEKKTSYPTLNKQEALQHICQFVSGIWQIHPFAEGNTRTTAVFTIKYLKTFGFTVNNDVFKEHSWYFRNSLVRANYNNYVKGISATPVYLERFFKNLLFGENNRLSNREMNIHFCQSAKSEDPKSQYGTSALFANCSLDEIEILNYLSNHPKAKQSELATFIRKSERTVKRITPKLIEKGLLERIGGRSDTGSWIVKAID